MKIILTRQFKEDFKRVNHRQKNSEDFNFHLKRIVSSLYTNKTPPVGYAANKLMAKGLDCYGCYVCADIVMIYLLHPNSVKLLRIGDYSELCDL